MGSGDSRVAHRLDESGHRPSRRAGRAVERPRHPTGRYARGWNEDTLDVYGYHSRLISLAGRGDVSESADLDARGRVPGEAEDTMSTSTIDQKVASGIAGRILREGYGEGAWHGPDLKAALADVNAEL